MQDLSVNKNKNKKKDLTKHEDNWTSNFFSELSTCSHTVLRHPRVNGADIYVARVKFLQSSLFPVSDITATPVGCARPCTRCLIWCRWAGIRRVFYWASTSGSASDTDTGGEGGFVSIKPAEALRCVGDAEYLTQADRKIAEGTFEFL
ncbi:hypothetical protein FRC12_016874 [Ceratobasidium sp. 428]|nr:hypothetical protein FRC12_016874 [Ceratobasidium sp. 428]